MVIASSRQLEQKSPQLALKLYPLNTDALLAWGIETLGGSGGDTSIEAIGSSARSAIPLNAGDARIYSLVGETMRRQGQDTAAYAMFDHALLLAKTEIHALQWSIQRAVEKRDYREVTNRLDVLFRRWPERIAPLAEALPAVYSNADGYSALLSQLGDNPPWRERLIAALTADTAKDLGFAQRLVQDMAVGRSPSTATETAEVLATLFKREQYNEAYRTFLLTLTPAERELSGFVFDGTFQQGPSARIFDWSVRQQPGVTTSLPQKADTYPGQPGNGLLLEFNNTPVLNVGVSQYLLLPPGGYSIALHASAFAAKLPKGLVWTIACRSPSKQVLNLDVPEGDYKDRAVDARFSVPGDCPIQVLRLRTNAIAESWSERYSGRVLIHALRISAVQS
ncbi:MAG: hypothetical protein WBA36_08490 [Mesorhizobium sp.]